MSDLVFENVQKVFPGGVTAVEGFTLTIPEPRMTVLVGPSGCGKTTLLRLIAGLDTPTSGAIYLDGARLDTLPPKDRDIAMVFQSYALYPHMSVEENLSFGLRLRKVPKERIAARVHEVAKTLEIDGLLSRKPGALSGGQRQRVALGRAIIREPRVFLFDEPLSNLDARLRVEMRATIKKLYQRLEVTSIYVTHDQVEAMTIGELLVVMNRGHIHQVGTPETCYHRPADTFVASFLGSPSMNFLDGRCRADSVELTDAGDQTILLPSETVEKLRGGSDGAVTVGIRPEDIHPAQPADKKFGVELSGAIVLKEPLGHETLTHIQVGTSEIIARGGEEFKGDDNGRTAMYVDGGSLHLFFETRRRTLEYGLTEGPLLEPAILFLNRLFKPPNVGGRESEEAYSRWEHRWGREVAKKYLEPAGDLGGKTVLDVGCGLGGKTVAYEEAGVRGVVGTDILVENVAASREYAKTNADTGRSAFLTSDAANLPFRDGSFDTVVANDAMEHFSQPAQALEEMRRVTRRGGAIWIFFTPHFSPLGSHLYDYIYTPWCHVLFSRTQIKRAIERILPARQPGASRDELRDQVEKIMTSYDEDLNHMTVRWFLRIIKRIPSLQITLIELRPAKFGFLKPLTRIPVARELVTGFVVCRLERVG